jgi:hypothetical protein
VTQPETQSLSVNRVYHPEFEGLKLYGGEYPYSSDDIKEFIDLGITTSICLVEYIFTDYPNEVKIKNTDFKLLHYPIRDFSVPSKAFMTSILDKIDELIANGESIYVHCQGGHGRTGTVIGCWLKKLGFFVIYVDGARKITQAAMVNIRTFSLYGLTPNCRDKKH